MWNHVTTVAKFLDRNFFLDRDGRLHCPTMEQKYGLPFWSWELSSTGKSYMSIYSFSLPHLYRTTVCWHPELLLPWQRDVTTSPLYCLLVYTGQQEKENRRSEPLGECVFYKENSGIWLVFASSRKQLALPQCTGLLSLLQNFKLVLFTYLFIICPRTFNDASNISFIILIGSCSISVEN